MLRVNADTFVLLMRSLTDVASFIERMEESGTRVETLVANPEARAAHGEAVDAVREEASGSEQRLRGLLNRLLEGVATSCASLQLELARVHARHIQDKLASNPSLAALRGDIRELEKRIEDECEGRLFLFVPSQRAKYFLEEHPFGEKVENKFPKFAEDISEASKCLGAGRYTAAVFHLMRVMEAGLTRLVKVLRLTIHLDRPWGAILKDINQAINLLPASTTQEVARHDRFAEVCAYLHHVKNAWRNNTMYPKRTYTEEEAENIFRNVRAFMELLVSIR
jgi:HEPN domain-containing protein